MISIFYAIIIDVTTTLTKLTVFSSLACCEFFVAELFILILYPVEGKETPVKLFISRVKGNDVNNVVLYHNKNNQHYLCLLRFDTAMLQLNTKILHENQFHHQ